MSCHNGVKVLWRDTIHHHLTSGDISKLESIKETLSIHASSSIELKNIFCTSYVEEM
jgi:hypothetical protein